ncbi:MAG TPA: carboxypeptidase-like regulatory domain-containing protein [Candidatus Dormibacteraeota bacterium]|nr:carboxypeptidase-like regulatory domain-containing protein [Candidatus Dormibacteraeota bacterium]
MKNTRFMMMMAGCLCAASLCCAGEEKSTLPLPDPGNVTLTLDEYNKLVELAAKLPKKLDVAPLPYSIKHAEVKLRVESNGVMGSVEFEGEVFRKGVSKVPLTSGMTILDAHQGGKGVALIQEGGTHAALLPGPGDFSLALDTGLPLRIDAGRASFNLPVPAAGSVQLALVIPGEHTFANVSPGVITSRKSENGHTAIEATLVPGQPASVWWATREVVAPVVPRETRFLAEEKTLVSVSEALMRVTVLADVTVVQGEPAQFHVELPAGYEITGVTGATLDSAETQAGVLMLKVNAPGLRNHQFLISMERSINDTKADAPFLSFKGAQREDGEVLVEGAGAMEITAKEGGGLKRMDVKEANPYLRSLAHYPPQAAFRYHRQPSETPTLALNWVRYPDGSVLAAVAESASVTTMVTSEGKSLTEVKLTVKNQAQPFLKVALPQGATILSAEVAGERVKPVQGADGSRVPLLRPGFRPSGPYTVSFVFMHSGAPFAKKGGADLSLPSMDIPISLLNWEVFLPERYKVKDFGGDVIASNLVPVPVRDQVAGRDDGMSLGGYYNYQVQPQAGLVPPGQVPAGQMGGFVTDPSGAVVPNVRITVTSSDNGTSRSSVTDSSGRWALLGLPSGNYKVRADASGFKSSVNSIRYNADQPSMFGLSLQVGGTTETVEVTAEAPMMNTESASLSTVYTESRISGMNGRNYNQAVKLAPGAVSQNASINVVNLQKRVSGVLPVAIDVPRAGTSFSFVRPLVLDEETKVTFSYKSR